MRAQAQPPCHSRRSKRESSVFSHLSLRHSRRSKRESSVLSHPSPCHSRRSKRESSVLSHPSPCHSRRSKRESSVLSHPPQSWLRSSPPAKPAASRLDLYPFLHNIRPNVKTDQPSSNNRTSQPQYILPKGNTPIHDAQKLKKETDHRKQRMNRTATNMDKLADKFVKWNGVQTICAFVTSEPSLPGGDFVSLLSRR